MGHLLYLMFRCDGKFGKFEEVGGTKHSRRENLNSLSFAAEEQIEMTDERLAPRGPNPVA